MERRRQAVREPFDVTIPASVIRALTIDEIEIVFQQLRDGDTLGDAWGQPGPRRLWMRPGDLWRGCRRSAALDRESGRRDEKSLFQQHESETVSDSGDL